MNEEKRQGMPVPDLGKSTKEVEDKKSAASRARNRTVMLTPEMTGQVRAMLYQEPDEERPDPVNELISPLDWSRPESAGNVTIRDAERPAAASESSSNADFGRDFSALGGDSRPRGGSTGKIDLDVVAEAMEQPTLNDQGKRSMSQSGFSVNPHAVPRPGMSGQGVARRAATGGGSAHVQSAPTSKIVGFLIAFDKEKNGEVHDIRAGRWLVTSRATDHGDFILINDETISPLHAIVRATKEGKVQILDQLSEFGTGVTRVGTDTEEEVAGAMVGVDHGDVLRLGQRKFVVCLIPKIAETATESE